MANPEPVRGTSMADWLRTVAPPARDVPRLTARTPADDTVLRMALWLWAYDPQSALPDAARQALSARLRQDAAPGHALGFTAAERAAWQPDLLAFYAQHHPTCLDVLTRQCADLEG